MEDKFIQNDQHQQQNFKIVPGTLKNMSLHGVAAHEETKYQNFSSFFEVNISKMKGF